MRNRLTRAILALVWVSMPAIASAQAEKATLDSLYVDFSVPDLPAVAALGLNPTKVNKPGTLKELSVAAFPIVGGDSSIGPGVAIAWAPVYSFAKSLDDYRKPVLRRLAFSLVTAKDGTTSAVNAGGGFRLVLFDHADPAVTPQPSLPCDKRSSDDYECGVIKILESEDGPTRRSRVFQSQEAEPVVRQIAELMTNDSTVVAQLEAALLTPWDLRKGPTPFTAAGQRAAFNRTLEAAAKDQKLPVPTIDQALSAKLDALSASFISQAVVAASTINAKLIAIGKVFRESHWNAASANFDVGIVARSESGNWSDLHGRTVGELLSIGFPFGNTAQLVLQAQGRQRTGTAPTEKSYYGGGAQLLVGTSTKRFSIEGLGGNADSTDDSKKGSSYRFTVGTEFRVASGFWLEVAFGGEHLPGSTNSHLLSLANFKYAFKNEPRFSQIPGSVDEE
jgi:hypothetical protein